MKQGIICPVSGLKEFAGLSNYHLVLAHVIEGHTEYKNFYKSLGENHFITLDNSSYEIGDDVYSPEDLMSIAQEVNADEIMAPETYRNGKETTHKILDFCSRVSSEVNVFGTIHGKTLEEIIKCFLDVYKFVKTVGFSCRLDFEDDIDLHCNNKSMELSLKRLFVVSKIFHTIRKYKLDVSHLEFHLLGMNHPMELLWYDKRIRSCDSSCAYTSGRNNVVLEFNVVDYVKPKDRIAFSSTNGLSKVDNNRIFRNITFLDRLMSGHGGF